MMTRRDALTVIATVAATSTTWPSPVVGAQPYSPYAGVDYRVVDLANVRELIIRFPQGTVTVPVEDVWKALAVPKEQAGD